jgi:hypothetical protein
MLDLATVTCSLVPTVTRHDLLPAQPCVTRLGLALFTVTDVGGFNVYVSMPPFLPTLCCFPLVGHPSWLSLLFLGCHSYLLVSYIVSLRGLSSRLQHWPLFSATLPQEQLLRKWPGSPQVQQPGRRWPLGLLGRLWHTKNVPVLAYRSMDGVPAATSTASSWRAWSRPSFSVLLSPTSSRRLRSVSLFPSTNTRADSLLHVVRFSWHRYCGPSGLWWQ